MNSPLDDLGRVLASAFHEQMARWSVLESGFSADSLSASIDLAGDILSLEESCQSFAAIEQVLETDFIPEDLVVVSRDTSEPSDSLASTPRPLQPENDPFVAAQWPTASITRLADEPMLAAHRPLDNRAGSQLTGYDADESALKSLVSVYPIDENPSFQNPEDQVQPETEFSAPDLTRIADSELSMSDRKELKPDDPTMPAPLESEAMTADSFWRQPLQNLHDFASYIHYTADEQNKTAKQQHPVRMANQAIDPFTAGPAWTTADEPEKSKTGIMPAAQGKPAIPEPVYETHPVYDPPELLSFAAQTSGFPTREQAFQSPLAQQPPSTDTDDLLDALTERIFRDFRRYYP